MTEWKVRIGFLPRDLADEARHVVIDKVPEEAQYEVFRLVERAFSAGYQDGYVRAHTEESWRQFKAAEAVKKQAKQETEEQTQ